MHITTATCYSDIECEKCSGIGVVLIFFLALTEIAFDFCTEEVACVACRAPRGEMGNTDIIADRKIHSGLGQRCSELLNANWCGILR